MMSFTLNSFFGTGYYKERAKYLIGAILDPVYWPENLKKSRPKKLVKSNKPISIFCYFKNGQKQFLNLEKV